MLLLASVETLNLGKPAQLLFALLVGGRLEPGLYSHTTPSWIMHAACPWKREDQEQAAPTSAPWIKSSLFFHGLALFLPLCHPSSLSLSLCICSSVPRARGIFADRCSPVRNVVLLRQVVEAPGIPHPQTAAFLARMRMVALQGVLHYPEFGLGLWKRLMPLLVLEYFGCGSMWLIWINLALKKSLALTTGGGKIA